MGYDANYKLKDTSFFNVENVYISFMRGGSRDCYLSPKLMKALKKRDLNPDHDPLKSNVFSLGMICLQMANLCEINDCYDFESIEIK